MESYTLISYLGHQYRKSLTSKQFDAMKHSLSLTELHDWSNDTNVKHSSINAIQHTDRHKYTLYGKIITKKDIVVDMKLESLEARPSTLPAGIVMNVIHTTKASFVFYKDMKIWMVGDKLRESPYKLDVNFKRYYCASI